MQAPRKAFLNQRPTCKRRRRRRRWGVVSFRLNALAERVPSLTLMACCRTPRTMLAAAAMRLSGVAAASALPAAAAAFAPACHTAFTKLAPSLVQLERFSASRVGSDACTGRLRRLVQLPAPTAGASQIATARWYCGHLPTVPLTCPSLHPPLPPTAVLMQFAPKAAEPALAEEVSGA